MQAGRNPGAARPILRLGPGGGQRRIDIALAQVPGDIGQAGAKGKGMNPRPALPLAVGNSMDELQHHPRILRHGAGDVADHDQVRPALAGRFAKESRDFSALAQRGAQRAAPVRPRPKGIGHRPARGQGADGQRETGQHPPRLGHFRRAHLFEIQGPQTLLRGQGKACVDLDLFRGKVPVPDLGQIAERPVQQGLCRTFFPCGCLAVILHAAHGGQQQAHHLFQIARVAPEQAEHLGKDRAVFGAADKAGVQRPVEIGALGKPGGFDRPDCIQNPAGADGQTRLAQRTGKMGDVVAQLAIGRQIQGRGVSHGRKPPGSGPRSGGGSRHRARTSESAGLRSVRHRRRTGPDAAARPGHALSARSCDGHRLAHLVQQAFRLGALNFLDVVLILQDRAQRIGNHLG